ncbi:MAG: hypothetical protein R3303_11650 [Marinobacter sp.]|nr:hypothetical protein [Marinobacter sp.]
MQVKWLNTMDRTGEDMIPHPMQRQADEPAPDPEPKPAEPLAKSEGNPEPDTKKPGLIGLLILGAATAVALFT